MSAKGDLPPATACVVVVLWINGGLLSQSGIRPASASHQHKKINQSTGLRFTLLVLEKVLVKYNKYK